MLTIIAALQDEIRLIKAEMEVDKAIHLRPFSILTGKYRGKKITLVRAGVGKESTKLAIKYCIDNLSPSLLLNIGYAGGLDPHLHAGDIAIADTVIDEASENSWTPDKNLISRAKSISENSGLRYYIGKMVTVGKAITDPHDKAFTGTRFEAIACEMESSFVAEAAIKAKIPFLVARSIIDPMDTELPKIPESAIIGGQLKIGRMISHLKSNPKDILKLPKFGYLANQARISLTNFVKEWVKNENEKEI